MSTFLLEQKVFLELYNSHYQGSTRSKYFATITVNIFIVCNLMFLEIEQSCSNKPQNNISKLQLIVITLKYMKAKLFYQFYI